MKLYLVCVILAVIVGVLRFILPVEGHINKDDIFKDLAHCFVGGVTLASIVLYCEGITRWRGYAILTAGLTVLEIVAFIARRA